MRTRRRNATIVGVILIAVVALGTIKSPSRIENVIAPPVTLAPGSDSTPSDQELQEFVQLISPSLDTVIGEGTELAELGMSRSRNVLELSIRMDRFKDASAELEALIDSNVVPNALSVDIQLLRSELDRADQAIDESISAIRAFDWDALAVSVTEFDSAIKSCESIAQQLYS